jgi:hypothetical protein
MRSAAVRDRNLSIARFFAMSIRAVAPTGGADQCLFSDVDAHNRDKHFTAWRSL